MIFIKFSEGLKRNEYQNLTKKISLGVEIELILPDGMEINTPPSVDVCEVDDELNYVFYGSSCEGEVIKDVAYDIYLREVLKKLETLNKKLKEFDIDFEGDNKPRSFMFMKEKLYERYSDMYVYLEDVEDLISEVHSYNKDAFYDLNKYFFKPLVDSLNGKLREYKKGIETEKTQLKLYDLVKDTSTWDPKLKFSGFFESFQRFYDWYFKEFGNFIEITMNQLNTYNADMDIYATRYFERQAENRRESYEEYYKGETEGVLGSIFKDYQGLHFSGQDYTLWFYTEDQSLTPAGIEFVSPVMSYDNFIEDIPKICRDLEEEKLYANSSCGYHVGVSHEDFNMVDKVKEVYEQYKKIYNDLTASVMAVNIGYKATFRHVPDRLETEYARNFIDRLSSGIIFNIKKSNVSQLMYSSDFKDLNLSFKKFVDINLQHKNHIEVRTLGGMEGFDILKDPKRLKAYLYDAINQVWSGIEVKPEREVVRVMSQFLRNGREYTKDPEYVKAKQAGSGFRSLKDKNEDCLLNRLNNYF